MDEKEKDLVRAGRADLLAEHKTMLDNLTATQARCTELINDYRDMRELALELGASVQEIENWMAIKREKRAAAT